MKTGFFKEEKGSILVVAALFTTIVIGFCALVVDIGRVAVEKQSLQNAVDAACLAAARDLPDTARAAATADQYISLNGYAPGDIDVTFENGGRTVHIAGSKEVEYTFARIFGFESGTVHPSAAASLGVPAAFQYALFSGSQSNELAINGSVNIQGSAHSNSTFVINASSVTVSGAVEASSTVTIRSGSINVGAQVSHAPVVEMPDLAAEIESRARESGQMYYGNQTFNGSSISVDSPIYVEGNLTINGSSFTGKGCIFATGSITFNGSNLTGSSDDAVCFYSKTGDISIHGDGATVDGILFAPAGSIYIYGSNQTINGRLIAQRINMYGSNNRVTSSDQDLASIPSNLVRLVQ